MTRFNETVSSQSTGVVLNEVHLFQQKALYVTKHLDTDSWPNKTNTRSSTKTSVLHDAFIVLLPVSCVLRTARIENERKSMTNQSEQCCFISHEVHVFGL